MVRNCDLKKNHDGNSKDPLIVISLRALLACLGDQKYKSKRMLGPMRSGDKQYLSLGGNSEWYPDSTLTTIHSSVDDSFALD
jgi:hypothetical protein